MLSTMNSFNFTLTNKKNIQNEPQLQWVLKQTNFVFPTSLINYKPIFDNLTGLQIANIQGQSHSWKNGNYDIRTSTYRIHNGQHYPPSRWYNTLVSTSDFTRLPQHNTHGYVDYEGNEITGNYGQVAYFGGNYQGGINPGQYFTTVYDTTQSVAGEYLQFGFPFYLRMFQFRLRSRHNDQQIKRFTLVGSNDNGVTWNSVVISQTLQNVNASQYQTYNFSNTEKYKLYRVIGETVDNLQDWSYMQADCKGDAYIYE